MTGEDEHYEPEEVLTQADIPSEGHITFEDVDAYYEMHPYLGIVDCDYETGNSIEQLEEVTGLPAPLIVRLALIMALSHGLGNLRVVDGYQRSVEHDSIHDGEE